MKPQNIQLQSLIFIPREISYQRDYGIACVCVSCVGLLLTLIVTVIYVMHRDTPIVKASGNVSI